MKAGLAAVEMQFSGANAAMVIAQNNATVDTPVAIAAASCAFDGKQVLLQWLVEAFDQQADLRQLFVAGSQ